jgi:hypothetical protein
LGGGRGAAPAVPQVTPVPPMTPGFGTEAAQEPTSVVAVSVCRGHWLHLRVRAEGDKRTPMS